MKSLPRALPQSLAAIEHAFPAVELFAEPRGQRGLGAGRRRIELAGERARSYIPAMKNLELSQVEAEALVRELARIVEGDRYPLSPRVLTLKAILGKLRPEPPREPLPPLKTYAPPRAGRYGRRG